MTMVMYMCFMFVVYGVEIYVDVCGVICVVKCCLFLESGCYLLCHLVGFKFMGSVVLFICSFGCILYSAWSGV